MENVENQIVVIQIYIDVNWGVVEINEEEHNAQVEDCQQIEIINETTYGEIVDYCV